MGPPTKFYTCMCKLTTEEIVGKDNLLDIFKAGRYRNVVNPRF